MRARTELDIDDPSIDCLQALLLLGVAFTAAGKGKKAYMMLGRIMPQKSWKHANCIQRVVLEWQLRLNFTGNSITRPDSRQLRGRCENDCFGRAI
jgi:hypothetical protein